MARYAIQFKTASSGEWYTKAQTNSKYMAVCVARINNFTCACRLLDTQASEVLFEREATFTPPEEELKRFLKSIFIFKR